MGGGGERERESNNEEASADRPASSLGPSKGTRARRGRKREGKGRKERGEEKGGIERVITNRGYVLVTEEYRLCVGIGGVCFAKLK